MGFLRTSRLGKRYSSPLAWAIWLLLELPAMLVAVAFDKLGVLLRWIGTMLVRHVYYVFTRLARWVDGRPGWREADMMIGVMPPTPEGDAEVAGLAMPVDFQAMFEDSRKRGVALLERGPLSIEAARELTQEERSDVLNAIASLGGTNGMSPVITPIPPPDAGKV